MNPTSRWLIAAFIAPCLLAPVSAQDLEIRYSNSVQVRAASLDRERPASISIDGGAPQALPCSGDREAPTAVGYIRLDTETKGRLTCASGYLGGIYLSYRNAAGEPVSRSLALNDGDAGDEWERRSWISARRPGMPVAIEAITLSSSIDPMDGTLLGCTATRSVHTWDDNARELVEAEASSDLEPARFTPPIGVSSGCLDEEGKWRGP